MVTDRLNRTEKSPMIEKFYGGIERDKKKDHQLNCGCVCDCQCIGFEGFDSGMVNSAFYSDPFLLIIKPIN